MKKIILALLIILITAIPAAAQTQYPDYNDKYVNDFAGVLSQIDADNLTDALTVLDRETGIEMTVVTITSLADYGARNMELATYAARLFDSWGVGHKEANNGIMVMFSLGDREVWIEMGQGYAGQYNSQLQSVVDNRMLPYFRNGEYSRGLYEGANGVIGVVTGTGQTYGSEPPPQWVGVVVVLVIILLIAVFIAAGVNFIRKGKKGWGFVFLSIAGVLIVFLIKILFSGKKGVAAVGGWSQKEGYMRLLRFGLCLMIIGLLVVPAFAISAKDLPAEKEKALAGDSLSQVNVGDYYYARNQHEEALPWYRMAAAQGRKDARERLAYMYKAGLGTPQDLVKSYVLSYKTYLHYKDKNMHPEGREYYERYLPEMAAQLTPEQRAEAERRIQEPWEY